MSDTIQAIINKMRGLSGSLFGKDFLLTWEKSETS